ncbi:MAG: hypothetical protein ACFFBD_24770 [Candidatus Hodarchaeota archaeon]
MSPSSPLKYTHIKKNFLFGILYDVINTTFLHHNQFKHIDKNLESLGLRGWQSFPNLYLGKKTLLGEVSHAPYELKRVRYNRDVFPRHDEVKDPDIKGGMYYASKDFCRMAVQVSIDTGSKIPLRDIGSYDEKDLIGKYQQVSGEGVLFSLKIFVLRFVTLLLALTLGVLGAIFIAFLENSGILPQLEQSFEFFFTIETISIYDILGPAAGIVIAFYSGRKIYQFLHRPVLATFQRDFSDRITFYEQRDDEIDFEFCYDEEKPSNNILKDFMKQSYIFRRHHKTPIHFQADKVTHINEIFRITNMKRKQIILRYNGHLRSFRQLFRRFPTLGYFSDHFLVMPLEDFEERTPFKVKEIRYMHVGAYNLKFNFPPIELTVKDGFGAIQPCQDEEELCVIKGLATKNPVLFDELKRKEQVSHTESLVEGDKFWLIFNPKEMTWEIKITEDWWS